MVLMELDHDVGGFHNLKGLVVLGCGLRDEVDFHEKVVCLHSLHVVDFHKKVVCLHVMVVCLRSLLVVVVFRSLHLVVVCLHREDYL